LDGSRVVVRDGQIQLGSELIDLQIKKATKAAKPLFLISMNVLNMI